MTKKREYRKRKPNSRNEKRKGNRKPKSSYKDSAKVRAAVNKRLRGRFLRTNTLLRISAGQVRFVVTSWVAVEPKTWYGFETFDVNLVNQIQKKENGVEEQFQERELLANFSSYERAKVFARKQANKRTALGFDGVAGVWFYSPVCVLVYSARTIVVKFWVSDRVELEQFEFFRGLEVTMAQKLRDKATSETKDEVLRELFQIAFAEHFGTEKEDYRVLCYRLGNTLEPVTEFEPFRAWG